MFGKLKRVLLSSCLFAGGVYIGVWMRANSNMKKYLQSINSDTIKDASRLTNESFGINWGFLSDDIIMNRIDTGDILFIRYSCEECLTAGEMIACFRDTALFLDHESHTMGFGFRNSEGLFVYYNEFGTTLVKKYSEMISMPYFKEIHLMKVDDNDVKTHSKYAKIVHLGETVRQTPLQFINRVYRLIGETKEIKGLDEIQNRDKLIVIRTETNPTLRTI